MAGKQDRPKIKTKEKTGTGRGYEIKINNPALEKAKKILAMLTAET